MLSHLTIAALALPLVVSNCFGRSSEPAAIRPALPDTALTEPCADPVALPEAPEAVTVALWAADRSALVTCRDRHGALVDERMRLAGEGAR